MNFQDFRGEAFFRG